MFLNDKLTFNLSGDQFVKMMMLSPIICNYILMPQCLHFPTEVGLEVNGVTSLIDLCITDRVFGPATPSHVVYDVAARPVVKAAMEGVNGVYLISAVP